MNADLVASPHFRLLEGMVGEDEGDRVVILADEGENRCAWAQEPRLNLAPVPVHRILFTPDRDSPTFLGCLLHLVREAWGDDSATVQPNGSFKRWRVHIEIDGVPYIDDIFEGDDEGEALRAALLAAPPKETS